MVSIAGSVVGHTTAEALWVSANPSIVAFPSSMVTTHGLPGFPMSTVASSGRSNLSSAKYRQAASIRHSPGVWPSASGSIRTGLDSRRVTAKPSSR